MHRIKRHNTHLFDGRFVLWPIVIIMQSCTKNIENFSFKT